MYVSTQFRRLAQKSRSVLVFGALALGGAFAAPVLAQTQVTNQATVAVPAGVTDTSTVNNTSTVNVAVVAPRLEVTKVASVGAGNPFTVGVPASYTLTVRNTGTTATTAVATVTDTVPAGFTINSAAGCSIGGQTVTCTVASGLSEVAPGNTASFTINVTPTAASAGATNTATVSGGGDATCPATTARCVSSVTNPIQQLTVAIGNAATVNEGASLIYTVTLSGGTSTSAITIPVTYAGTATNGVDYTNVANVTIPAGSTTGTLTVPTLTDSIVEGSETVVATLGTPSLTGVTVTTASGTGTITDVPPTLTVNISGTPTVAEGGSLTFPVTMVGGTSTTPRTVNVTYTGTATNGTDYTNVATVVIPAGATTANLVVPTLTDTIVEGSETVIPAIATGVGYTVGTSSATGTITDLPPTLTVNISGTPTVAEGGSLTFPVAMTGGTSTSATTVNVTYTGTATNGTDYTNVATVVIPAGATTANLVVPTLTDTIVEGSETVIPAIATGAGYTVGTSNATGTILDGTAASTLSVAIGDAASVTEGGNLVYTVTLSGGTSATDIVIPVTYSGTATSGADYTSVANVTIPAGSTTGTLTLVTNTDTVVEGDEEVIATLGAPSLTGVTVSNANGTGTILDGTAASTLSVAIGDAASVTEGGNLVYTVTLSGGTSATDIVIPVTYTGTATSGADYTSVANVTIPAGSTTGTLTLVTNTDTVVEGDEEVIATLGAPSLTGVTVSNANGTGTILDGTAASTLSVAIGDAASVTEGGNLVYTVTLSGGTSATDIVIPVTYSGTATSGADYTSVANVTIPAGSTTGTLTLVTNTDTVVEGDEEVIATLGAPSLTGVTVSNANGTGTILDGTAASTLSVAIGDAASVTEGGNLVYTVTLSGGTSATDIVIPVTYSGTATSGADYTSVANVTIPAGSTTGTLTLVTNTDTVVEGDEEVIATLGAPSLTGVTVSNANGTGTILDGTAASTLSVAIGDAASVTEGGNLVYTVTLSGGTSATDIVIPVTYSGTATSGADYTSVANVTIPAGSTTGTLTLVTNTDTVVEGDEEVIATLGAPSLTGVTVSNANGTGTILDGTAASTLSVAIGDAASVTEGGNLVYTVTLSGGTSATDIVIPVTYTGTATDGADYTSVANVTIPAGQTTGTLTLVTATDTVVEGDETVIATLGTPSLTGVTVSDASGTGTILDGTLASTLSVAIGDAASVTEGGNLVYTVTLSGGTSATDIVIPVTYTGTATDGADYTSVANVTIPAGQTTGTLTLVTATDTVVEGDETVIATLGTPSLTGVTVSDASGTGTILDGTLASTLSVAIGDAASVTEGGNLVYTVTLSGGTSATDIVIPVTYTGTATDGADYTSVANVTIPAGQTTGTLTLVTATDTVVEGDETVIATLGTPSLTGVTVSDASGTGTILDGTVPSTVTFNKSVILPIGQTEVSVGDTLTYNLQVVVGDVATTSPVTLTDTLGQGLTLGTVTAGSLSCGAGNPLVCTLPAGTVPGTYLVAYTAVVNELATGFVRNVVVATGGGDVVTCQGTCQTETIVTEPLPAIVSYGKSAVLPAGKTEVTEGDVITYTLTTTVAAAPTSSGITLTDTLGAGLTFGAMTSAGAYVCNTANPLVCTLPTGTVPGVYTVTYTATVNSQASGVVRNAVLGSGADNPVCAGDCNVETPVRADLPEIRLSKSAGAREVKVGDLVRYTLTVENVGSSDLVNGRITDTPPAGFSYVEGSLVAGDADQMATVSGTQPIRIEGVDVRAGETATLVYVMRVGAGVRPGTHVNQAQARGITDEPVSNVATAEVTLTADALIDDSLLMGTVFNDRDGDGWQDSAALSGVKVQGGFTPGAYVANSTTVDRGAGPQPEPDASSPMLHGIAVGKIAGRQSVAEPVDAHEVVIRQRLSDVSFTDDFVLTSDQGVTVRMDAAGNTRIEQSGDAAKGLNAAAPTVERRVSQGEGGYIVDYVIRNTGIDERGIPGVRIASVEGLLIETDQYGRYHLAGVSGGAWERGRNFILKVDPSTLPTGAEFTTDNPLLRRITPGVPVRFDFGVKLPEQVIEGGEEQVELELGDVFFAPGSAEVRAQYLPVIEAMAAQVRKHGGGEVVISANGDVEALSFDRANAVKAALLKTLEPTVAQSLVVSVRGNVDDAGSLVVGVDEGGALLGTVLFDTGTSAIRPEFEPLLDRVAAALEKRGGGAIAIVGHTDVRGSHADNTVLGMRRAKAVYEALAKRLSPEVRAKVRVESSNDPTAPVGVRK